MIKSVTKPLSLLPLFALLSCVESSLSSRNSPATRGSGVNQNEVIEADGSNVQGKYAAEIWPINYNLHFKNIGVVEVSREGDEFSASVSMKYGPKDTKVKQAIYTARRCPNINDDLNKDAYIDILEARLGIGKMTIPLDGDLNSQLGGRDQFPVVDASGNLSWAQTASFSSLFSDLKAPDEDLSDQMTKLKDDEGITLPGRIVLFQGMPEKVALPESVATIDGEGAHESIPVGCAVLWKVN